VESGVAYSKWHLQNGILSITRAEAIQRITKSKANVAANKTSARPMSFTSLTTSVARCAFAERPRSRQSLGDTAQILNSRSLAGLNSPSTCPEVLRGRAASATNCDPSMTTSIRSANGSETGRGIEAIGLPLPIAYLDAGRLPGCWRHCTFANKAWRSRHLTPSATISAWAIGSPSSSDNDGSLVQSEDCSR